MNQFKVGDRIEVIIEPKTSIARIKRGMRGTILVIPDGGEPTIGVEFDDDIHGHDLAGAGKGGYCWYMFAENIQKFDKKGEDTNE